MSYWSSGFTGALGPGDYPLPGGKFSPEELLNMRALSGRGFDVSELAPEGELFRSFAQSTWSTSLRKRFFDTAVAAPALLAFLPVMGAVAVLIKCTSSGPVLFRQERLGLDQKPFTIYKFRTMHRNAVDCGPTVTQENDDRLTSVGRLLRKLKLDEVPQLYNVVRGDMSLVGPRPKLAHHERMYLFCRPGITGAATLLFAREEEILASVPQEHVETYAVDVLNPIKARLDMQYANSATLRSDLRVLLSTVFRLGRRGYVQALPENAVFSGPDQQTAARDSGAADPL